MRQMDLLWAYQNTDRIVEKFENELKNAPERQKLMKLRGSLLEAQGQLADMEGTVGSFDERLAASKEYAAQCMQKAKDVLKEVESSKETQGDALKALISSCAQAQEQLQKIERDIHRLQEEVSALDRKQKEIRMKAMKAKAEYTPLKEAYDEDFKSKAEKLEALRTKRKEASGGIEPAVLLRYKAVKQHHMPPIAKLKGDQCGGCNMSLPSVVVRDAMDDQKIVECENCGRILYTQAGV